MFSSQDLLAPVAVDPRTTILPNTSAADQTSCLNPQEVHAVVPLTTTHRIRHAVDGVSGQYQLVTAAARHGALFTVVPLITASLSIKLSQCVAVETFFPS